MDGDIELYTGHQNFVGAVAFTADGGTLASSSLDGTVKIWDVATGAPIRTLACGDGAMPHAVAIASDGQAVAAAVGVKTREGFSCEVRL